MVSKDFLKKAAVSAVVLLVVHAVARRIPVVQDYV